MTSNFWVNVFLLLINKDLALYFFLIIYTKLHICSYLGIMLYLILCIYGSRKKLIEEKELENKLEKRGEA